MASLLLVFIYLSFVSLGLPDSVLGSAWPSIYPSFGVPISYAGGISLIISAGTVCSSLLSERLTRRLGTGPLTTLSVGMTATALFGFSVSRAYWQLCLWAIPYGLGAGSVDAALNHYVALHYKSRHMSWLHGLWGVGAVAGPTVMGFVLTAGGAWTQGYRYISLFQMALTAVLLCSLPLWKKAHPTAPADAKPEKPRAHTLRQTVRIPGAKYAFLAFLCYGALEQTAGLWGSSYLVLQDGMSADTAAKCAGLFFLGITVGRFASGFLTFRLNDRQMVRLGLSLAACGLLAVLLPLGTACTLGGLVLLGLGCAPVYPCMVHDVPELFGETDAQAVIGVQMASCSLGICALPPLFGILAEHFGVRLFPAYLLVFLALLAVLFALLVRVRSHSR